VNGWLPGLVILLFVLGLALVLWQTARLANVSIHWLFILVGAEFLCLMTLSQAPDLYPILYWRTWMLTYLAPVIANTLLLVMLSAGYAGLMKRNQSKERWPLWIYLSALLGTILAGLLLTLPDIGELDPDPGYWYNQCAAGYYGVDTISANQPGWDQ
jgi:hypothetical protein